MTKRKENDNKTTLDEQEQEIETTNDFESEEFPDEPSMTLQIRGKRKIQKCIDINHYVHYVRN